jgi:hypothetical protein
MLVIIGPGDDVGMVCGALLFSIRGLPESKGDVTILGYLYVCCLFVLYLCIHVYVYILRYLCFVFFLFVMLCYVMFCICVCPHAIEDFDLARLFFE